VPLLLLGLGLGLWLLWLLWLGLLTGSLADGMHAGIWKRMRLPVISSPLVWSTHQQYPEFGGGIGSRHVRCLSCCGTPQQTVPAHSALRACPARPSVHRASLTCASLALHRQIVAVCVARWRPATQQFAVYAAELVRAGAAGSVAGGGRGRLWGLVGWRLCARAVEPGAALLRALDLRAYVHGLHGGCLAHGGAPSARRALSPARPADARR
jgi:hypothetical protein